MWRAITLRDATLALFVPDAYPVPVKKVATELLRRDTVQQPRKPGKSLSKT